MNLDVVIVERVNCTTLLMVLQVMFGAKRKSYTGAFKLKHLLKILVIRVGKEYE